MSTPIAYSTARPFPPSASSQPDQFEAVRKFARQNMPSDSKECMEGAGHTMLGGLVVGRAMVLAEWGPLAWPFAAMHAYGGLLAITNGWLKMAKGCLPRK